MPVSEKGLAFTAQREAAVLTVYRDTVHPAIGFGVNDDSLVDGQTITLEEAVSRFLAVVPEYEIDIDRAFSGIAMPQQCFDALFSLTYNIGATQLNKETMLLDSVEAYCVDTNNRQLRDIAAHQFISARMRDFVPFNLSRRCREVLVFISADYGDLSQLKLWGPGKNPKAGDPPELVPMPSFGRA